MVRAADAAALPCARSCRSSSTAKNRLGDLSYADRLQETNPHPGERDSPRPAGGSRDHRPSSRPAAFRAGKYKHRLFRVGARGISRCVGCRRSITTTRSGVRASFTRQAIEMKSPVPVLRMPPRDFVRPPPRESIAELRARFSVARGKKFLFLSLFDLNSYAERKKNPRAALEAFRASGTRGGPAAAIGRESSKPPPAILRSLPRCKAAVRDFARNGAHRRDALARRDLRARGGMRPAFLSLHRAEGFLDSPVAECMFLEEAGHLHQLVSEPRSFVNAANGCPVDYTLVTLDRPPRSVHEGARHGRSRASRTRRAMDEKNSAGDPARARGEARCRRAARRWKRNFAARGHRWCALSPPARRPSRVSDPGGSTPRKSWRVYFFTGSSTRSVMRILRLRRLKVTFAQILGAR